jgi:predicted enzyme related to lactoylglutathione lyase
MPVQQQTVPGAPFWIDLSTSDLDRAVDFYDALFEWRAHREAGPEGDHADFTLDGVLVAGAMQKEADADYPDAWTPYLLTSDAAGTHGRVEEAGGTNSFEAMTIPGVCVMGVATDPSGATFGYWQPLDHPGFGVIGEPGAPAWFEVLARDYAASLAFYERAFDWTTAVESDTDEFRYRVLVHGDDQLAGIMDAGGLPPGEPSSYWVVYFGVADVDAAVASAIEHGGTVVRAAADSPYGRNATLADPTGAVFSVIAV